MSLISIKKTKKIGIEKSKDRVETRLFLWQMLQNECASQKEIEGRLSKLFLADLEELDQKTLLYAPNITSDSIMGQSQKFLGKAADINELVAAGLVDIYKEERIIRAAKSIKVMNNNDDNLQLQRFLAKNFLHSRRLRSREHRLYVLAKQLSFRFWKRRRFRALQARLDLLSFERRLLYYKPTAPLLTRFFFGFCTKIQLNL